MTLGNNEFNPTNPHLALVDTYNPLILVASTANSWTFICIYKYLHTFTISHCSLEHRSQNIKYLPLKANYSLVGPWP